MKSIHSCFHWYNKRKNRPRNAGVIIEKVTNFMAHGVCRMASRSGPLGFPVFIIIIIIIIIIIKSISKAPKSKLVTKRRRLTIPKQTCFQLLSKLSVADVLAS